MTRPLSEILAEANQLMQMDGEWKVEHAAAFCTVSESFIYGSDCPRIEKEGQRDIGGKPMLRFLPAEVKQWNAARTKKRRAA